MEDDHNRKQGKRTPPHMIAIATPPTSSPDESPISSKPEEYFTHFTKLMTSNKRGQTRYRCRTCLHEFECSGKIRRIQHILGNDLYISKEKNVRSCPNPYLPLKHALLELYRSATGEETYNKNRKPVTPKITPTTSADTMDASADHVVVDARMFSSLSPLDFGSHSSSNSFHSMNHLLGEAYANQLIYKFLSRYNLPVTIVGDPIFQNFIDAITSTGPEYRPHLGIPLE